MMTLVNPSSAKFSYSPVKSSTRISHKSPSFVSMVSNHNKRKSPKIKSASTALTNTPVNYSPSIIESFRVDDQKPAEARIDEWMEGSVTDIVQNLKQAPLLVLVYPEVDRRGNSKFEFKTEKAIRENWPTMKSKWKSGQERSPDGLIFVEELLDDENGSSSNEAQSLEDGREAVDGVTRAWGIVVQGRGVRCGPACYLLKTTRVEAGCGLGLFCTHFCLAKVSDFRESALRQLQDFWLLQ